MKDYRIGLFCAAVALGGGPVTRCWNAVRTPRPRPDLRWGSGAVGRWDGDGILVA